VSVDEGRPLIVTPGPGAMVHSARFGPEATRRSDPRCASG